MQRSHWRRLERVEGMVHSTLWLLGPLLMASAAFGTSAVGRSNAYCFWTTTGLVIVALAVVSAKFWVLPAWRRKLALRTLDDAVQRLYELGIKTERE